MREKYELRKNNNNNNAGAPGGAPLAAKLDLRASDPTIVILNGLEVT